MQHLNVIQPGQPKEIPLFVATDRPVIFGAGFHAEEREDGQAFRWMTRTGRLEFGQEQTDRFLELWVLSEFQNLQQMLSVTAGGSSNRYPLGRGWIPLSVTIPAGLGELQLEATPEFPAALHPADQRVLTVRVRGVRLHEDPARHDAVRRQYENAVRNQRELLDGRVALESTPPSLGIDLHGVCNVKPPCVYCEWDYSKDLEGADAEVPFTAETLSEWGAFFDNSVHLVNCSIGEPFMMRNIDDLFDIFGNTGKLLEMTTNGQILTDRNIQKLLGRPIELYISLDAATPVTYSRLRNNTFEKIVTNVRRLVSAKGGPGRFPHVYLVFMPMRCNVHELDDFLRLCVDLQVDRAILRPLNYSPASTLDTEREGYQFDYQKELLPFAELLRASARARRVARQLGVPLSDQMNFGGSLQEAFPDEFEENEDAHDAPAAEASAPPAPVEIRTEPPAPEVRPRDSADVAASAAAADALPLMNTGTLPACQEPWKSLYILRRGVMPCCYGGAPIAPMGSYRESWNSPVMQDIRHELLNGRFHDYCLRSPACPIVRKADHSATLPLRQRVLLRSRDYFARVNRHFNGTPIAVWQTLRRTAARVHARAARLGARP